MKRNNYSKVRKIMILAAVLVLMLALCGCRTRITNNDEVSNVMYDEKGSLQDEYNMRRDELGLSRAKKPIFTGFGAPEEDYEDYDYGEDAQTLEDYEPDESEEPYDDTEEPESASGSASGSGTSESGSGKVIRKRTSGGNSSADATEVEVVLDAGTNGGTIGGSKTATVSLKKTGTYDLPSPDARDGYNFTGWFTRKEGGTNVDGRKLASEKKHKLYAQWEKVKTEPDKDPYKYWEAQLRAKAELIEKKCKYKSGTDAGEFLQDCGMESTDGDDYDFEIFYGSKEDVTPGSKEVLVIPKEATKSTTKDNVKLIYKLKVITTLYEGTGLDVSKAAEELEVNESELESIEIIPAKNDDPE